jgi:hypothetical protein
MIKLYYKSYCSILKLTTLMCRLSRNPGALTSRTPQGHIGLFQGYFYSLKRVIREAKKVYFKHLTKTSENKTKPMWNIINKVTRLRNPVTYHTHLK